MKPTPHLIEKALAELFARDITRKMAEVRPENAKSIAAMLGNELSPAVIQALAESHCQPPHQTRQMPRPCVGSRRASRIAAGLGEAGRQAHRPLTKAVTILENDSGDAALATIYHRG